MQYARVVPWVTPSPCVGVRCHFRRRACCVARDLGRIRRISRASECRAEIPSAKAEPMLSTQKESTQTSLEKPPSRAEDYSRWYQYVIAAADLAENSPVKGCMVIKPNGYAIWEKLQNELDRRIKESGVKNAYFPLLIPQSFLSKEAAHVEGFAKECAVVTHHRLRAEPGGDGGELEPDPDSKLEEPLVIRPTSETIVWHMFSKWIQSYRDLPLMINQWANVVRWEMRTRPFLRTAEFLWQEGHTAHATADEAHAKAIEMIDMYADVVESMLAIPVVKGIKSPSERFAGADETYTIETMMQNGWALQAGTSHFLGQSFAKAFDVTYQSDHDTEELVWASSWGITTRLLGALIMTHSDDTGLVVPPAIAPIHVVIVLIYKNSEQKETLSTFANNVAQRLKNMRLSVVVDDRENIRPGAKYFEWEKKGVPLRFEIGPRDAAKSSVLAARRNGGKKYSIAIDADFETNAQAALDSVQTDLLESARQRLDRRTCRVSSYAEMKQALAASSGSAGESDCAFFLAPWSCNSDNERSVKEETKATLRCYPLSCQHEAKGKKCFFSGEDATHMALFARAY